MLLAAWAGFLLGVLEGLAVTMLRVGGWPVRAPVEILWIAPVVNGVLFLGAGFMLAAVTWALGARMQPRLFFTALLWMLGFGFIQAPGVIQPGAAVLLALGAAVASSRARGAVEWWSRLARRTILPLALAAGAATVVGLAWSPVLERRAASVRVSPQPDLPNVLLIVLDTLRADHVSAYGYARPTTPNLDRFAERGVLFEHAFANSSWTLPAHASLLTGRLPHEHGADWREPMKEGLPTVAEVFAGQGYLTAAFAANTSYVAPEWGLGRGFGRFEVYGGSWADDVVRTAYGRRLALNLLPRLGFFDVPGRKRASQVNGEFLSWIDEAAGRPFFALLNYFDVHDPYLTIEPHHTRFSPQAARGDVINFQLQPHVFRRKPTLSAAEVQAEVDAYDGCLAYLDEQLGVLFAELSRRDLDGNTLIVVTSDHGESFGNHDLFGHGNSLYLETLHVPLVVVWRGRVPAGVRVSLPVGLDRVAATIEELTHGGHGGSALPGRSLAPMWVTGDAAGAFLFTPVLSEVSRVPDGPVGYPTRAGSLTSLVTPEWHLIMSSVGDAELYEWTRDPSERANLAESPQGRAIVEDLKRVIERVRGNGGS